MCETSELIVMVADSEKDSLDKMCNSLSRLGIENLLCAISSAQGLHQSRQVADVGRAVSMLFCNPNLQGADVSDFIQMMTMTNTGLITITYSKCIRPEAHIMSLLEHNSMDHIEQNVNFEERVTTVTNRWLKAACLQFDYGQKYGFRKQPAL